MSDTSGPPTRVNLTLLAGQIVGMFVVFAAALFLAALFLAAAMTATGLGRRIALTILSKVGTETRNVVIGTIVVGFVIALMVPSTTARVACLVPITLGIIAAFGVDRRGAFAGMLMITTVQTASIWNVGIKTAAAQNMVAIGFIEKAFGRTITWLDWLIAAGPFAVIRFAADDRTVEDVAAGREVRLSLRAGESRLVACRTRRIHLPSAALRPGAGPAMGRWLASRGLEPGPAATTADAAFVPRSRDVRVLPGVRLSVSVPPTK